MHKSIEYKITENITMKKTDSTNKLFSFSAYNPSELIVF